MRLVLVLMLLLVELVLLLLLVVKLLELVLVVLLLGAVIVLEDRRVVIHHLGLGRVSREISVLPVRGIRVRVIVKEWNRPRSRVGMHAEWRFHFDGLF